MALSGDPLLSLSIRRAVVTVDRGHAERRLVNRSSQSARAARMTENVPMTPHTMSVHTKKNPPLEVAIAGYLVPLM